MTDNELLALAAKAVNGGGWHPMTHEKLWNPLTDDGDALRLFGRMPFCEIYVSKIGCTVSLPRKPPGESPNLKCDEYANEHNGDLQAAIRRAIVRATALIGKEMQCRT